MAKVKLVTYEHGTFVTRETPMDVIWPAGDPCPNDKETLVVFQTRTSLDGNTQKEN